MAIYSWKQTGSNFGSNASWTDGVTDPAASAPGSGDDTYISGQGVIAGSGTVNSITFLVANYTLAIGVISAGTILTNSASGSSDSITLNAGTLRGTVETTFDRNTTFTIDGGATLDSSTSGIITNDGTLSVINGTISGNNFANFRNATIYANGVVSVTTMSNSGYTDLNGTTLAIVPGTLDVIGKVSTTNTVLGTLTGETSVATVETGGSWSSTNTMIVGELGTATLEIKERGSVTATGGGHPPLLSARRCKTRLAWAMSASPMA